MTSTPAYDKAAYDADIDSEEFCKFICTAVRRAVCGDAECTRDWWCAKDSSCARARDAALPAALARVFWTSAEREVAKYTDELERKEFLGTLTAHERRALKRRREEAMKYVRARAFAAAPESQRMARTTDFLAKPAMSASGRARGARADASGPCANRHDDDASPQASDGYADSDSRDSYWSDDDDDDGSEYASDGAFDDIEREFRENQRQRAIPKKWNDNLIVGRDLAFKGEGELRDGLRRWEEYITEARVADGLLEIKIDTQLDAFEAQLEEKLEQMRIQGVRAKWSEVDFSKHRAAIVAEHDARVADIMERERALREKKSKREKLASLDATKRAKLLRIWQQHADASRE